MEYRTFVDHVRQDGQRLAMAAGGDLSRAVPSCPGWSVRDLVSHVAQVYEHKILCTELGHAPDWWPPVWPPDRDPIEWFSDAHERLLAMFGQRGPESPSSTWWPADQTVGFWARRMAHETAIHRVDAELANDAPTPVDRELALDGIDEILVIMLAGDWSEDPDDLAAGQRVGITVGGSTWMITLERASMRVSHEAGVGDAAIQGDPSDVFMWLWGRCPDDSVKRTGEEELVGLLRSRLVLATQ